MKVFNKKTLVILLLIIVSSILISKHYKIVSSTYPVEAREGATFAITDLLIHSRYQFLENILVYPSC